MNICRIILICMLSIGFFGMLHRDINGRKAQEPTGFLGACTSIVAYAAVFILYAIAFGWLSINQ